MSRRILIEELQKVSYGYLVILKEEAPHTWVSNKGVNRSKRMFTCQCSCGSIVSVSLEHLRSGHTKSCGCHQKANASDCNITHGLYVGAGNTHPLHNLWRGMVNRCNNDLNYKELNHSEKFLKDPFYFYEYINLHLGNKPEGSTLDRIDNKLGYVEGNLRWADKFTQARNTKSRRGSKSKYKGVFYHKQNRKWTSAINLLGEKFYLGTFTDELEAARAYVIKYLELEKECITESKIQYYIEYFSR
jgi:hypothetical protein